MEPVSFLARRPQFAEHLAPVYLALPEEARGAFVVWGNDEAARRAHMAMRDMGIPASHAPTEWDLPRMGAVVVASYRDMGAARGRQARIALMPHGIGQSYAGRPGGGEHVGSPGGSDRDGVSLFLHPGPHPAARDRARYPMARVEQVGSPRLDRLARKPRDHEPVIAVSTHWCATLPPAPELHSALMPCPNHHPGTWHGIREAIAALTTRYRVIGHGHPRLIDRIAAELWEPLGIEVARTFDEVCRRADLYVADNTSTIYEFAHTDRPVVLMDPPWYDRNVGHGLRFWTASHVGLHVTDPRALTDVVAEALRGGASRRRDREDALSMVYAYRDHAAARAAVALLDWAGERKMAA